MKRNNFTTFWCLFSSVFNPAIILMIRECRASTSRTMISKEKSTFESQYERKDFVKCIDEMVNEKNGPVHVAFVGDSLIRNQFLNLITIIPDYDSNVPFHLKENESHFHEDQAMKSQLLNDLLISFRWRAIINTELIADFELWILLEDDQTPDIIFLGSTVHNMLQKDNSFWDKMENDLVPVLVRYLNVHPRKQLIWVMQSPTTDLLGPISEQNNYIVNVKRILHYNGIVRQLFKGTRVTIWEKLLPSIGEYIRSCFLVSFHRYDIYGYELCDDYIHQGHQVLSMGSQLILNHVCNPFLL